VGYCTGYRYLPGKKKVTSFSGLHSDSSPPGGIEMTNGAANWTGVVKNQLVLKMPRWSLLQTFAYPEFSRRDSGTPRG
jgi:hypothetical protein